MPDGKPEQANTPEQTPAWLTELAEQERWVPPNPTNLVEMRAACDFWWEDFAELSQITDIQRLAFAENLDHFLILTRALAQTAEGQGIDSTPLILFLHDAESLYFGHLQQFPPAGTPVHILLDRLKFKLAAALNLQPVQQITASAAPRPVVLQGPGKPVLVCGKEKRPLTTQQTRVVQALLAAGAKGLSKDELDRKSEVTDARKVLKRLSESDPDWLSVIQLAGATGRGYRIVG